MLSNQKSKLNFVHILKKYEGHVLFLIIISAFYCPNFWSEKNSDWKGSITEERVWNLELTVVAVKKNPQRIGGSINMYLNPMNRSWAVPKHKHSQPNFDWTKANSFQVKTSVTDGNEVIPKIIVNPYETTTIRIRKKHNFTFPISKFLHTRIYLYVLPAVKKHCSCHFPSHSIYICSKLPTDMQA
mgnify:CR=1 FL=1